MRQLHLKNKELFENPVARLPICLVLDTSGSMSGEPIMQLKNSLQQLLNNILQHDVSKASIDLAIISFGNKVNTLLDFQNVKPNIYIELNAHGKTPMGAALTEANYLINRRLQLYKTTGVEYYKPWVLILTDGAPTDDINHSANLIARSVKEGRINVFPIGIGEYADLDTLQQFTPDRKPFVLDQLNFNELFSWLFESVKRVSESMPGEEIIYPSPDKWNKIGKK